MNENTINDFSVAIDNAALIDLRSRITHARWPERETVTDWSQGVPLDILQNTAEYWLSHYDWRACEKRINSYTNLLVTHEEVDFHVLISENPQPKSIPLLLLNGWPSSVCEYFEVIKGLQSLDIPLTLVFISMPGYGFSSKPTENGWSITKIAHAFTAIMHQLGFSQFIVHGSDWGSMIAPIIATQYPASIIGIHATMPFANHPGEELELDDIDQKRLQKMQDFSQNESGYSKIQATRPQTLGYSLTDSPIGQLAWVLEKFWFWSDHEDKNLFDIFSIDHILDTASIYWLTASGTSSARSYWESLQNFEHLRFEPVHVPAGFSIPTNDARMPRPWMEKRFTDLRYWHDLPSSGHFLAAEKPELFIEEINNFLKCLDVAL